VDFLELMLMRRLRSSVGERNAALERVMELRIRLNCFSSSDGGLELEGLMVLRLSSVGRWRRRGGDSTWLIVEVGREKMEFDWDCERSCVGGIGAVLEGGVKERDGLCGITGGEVADLEGSEREGFVRDTSVVGGMGGDLVGAEAGNCTGDSSFLGGVGAVLEGAATAASTGDSFLTGGMGAALEGAQCTDDSSFVGGTGAILVGASQDFTTTSSFVGGSGAILSGGAIFGTGAGCSTSSSLSSPPSGVPHLD
jgi:hypothetical protein